MRYDIQKRYRENKKKEGRCYFCNKKAVKGMTRCQYHRRKHNKRMRMKVKKWKMNKINNEEEISREEE